MLLVLFVFVAESYEVLVADAEDLLDAAKVAVLILDLAEDSPLDQLELLGGEFEESSEEREGLGLEL